MGNKSFQKGHKLAPGGKRDGAGRKPDWLKWICQDYVEEIELVKFWASVARGDKVESISVDGKVTLIPASIKDRLAAGDRLVDRGFGKSIQPTMPVDDKGKYQPYSITVKIDDGGKSKS